MSKLLATISNYWNKIHCNFFPELEEAIDTKLSKKMQQLVAILDMIRIENYIPDSRGLKGRPPKNRAALARAFVAKVVLSIPTTSLLIDNLKDNRSLRIICGFENCSQIPVESTFSEAFSLFSSLNIPKVAHETLIKTLYKDELVLHVSKDSTAIKAREKPIKKQKEIKVKKEKRAVKGCAELTRLQKQVSGKMTLSEMIADLPISCNFGKKKSSSGHIFGWIGYKLHLSVDDNGVPLAAILSSASLNDSQAAIPLTEMTKLRVTNLYDLMDSGYFAEAIETHSRKLGHIPIIDQQAKNAVQKHEKEQEKLARKNLRWICAEKFRYRKRSVIERTFSRLKDQFGFLNIRVKGPEKVMTHLMFGLLAMAADQLLKLVT